ncbi:hypothetical protein OsJ_35422 [Oryza sativa Japonica Group]|uniref:Rad51-like C-terminal domain-containing protein n=1 Tax=Oryza sativa subsp. japonica TaxID=39947 RepID=B9GC59_ORYSJ|nr:hypothetical protein OsJ_35422 [Oryza sativa Japonica Group]
MGYVSGVPLLGAVAISAKKMYPGPDDRTEYKKRYIHLGSYTYPSVREYISRFLRLSSPSPARVSSLDLAVLVLLCSGAGGVASDFTDGHASSFSGRLQKTELAHTICVTSQTVYASAYTYEDMEALLSDLQSKMEKEPFKMLIINSVTTLFNTELCNGCAFDGCQIKTLEMMYCLRMIANKFHIGVYVTNHEEMGLTDAKIKRSLKQGLYFKEVKDLRKLNNAVQVTTGNSSLGDMHQGGDMHEETFRMVDGCMEVSQHAVKDLDETSVCEDYKKISKLFLDMLELNKGHPLYLSHLCSKMKNANVTSAKSNTFQLFLRVHPSLMTYSTRSSLLWEMKREIDGLLPPNAKNIQSAIDQILMNRDWTLLAKQEAAFSPTYNRSYKKSSSECFKFIRNWLTHGIENFNTSDPRRFTTEDMDYLLEIVFKDFLADIVWTLLQNNIGNLNRWFADVQENNSF